jgi:hypothetical protein
MDGNNRLSWADVKLKSLLFQETQAVGVELAPQQVELFLAYGRQLATETNDLT